MCLEITPLILPIVINILHVCVFVEPIDIPFIVVSNKVEWHEFCIYHHTFHPTLDRCRFKKWAKTSLGGTTKNYLKKMAMGPKMAKSFF
jgi:hypothetical protein